MNGLNIAYMLCTGIVAVVSQMIVLPGGQIGQRPFPSISSIRPISTSISPWGRVPSYTSIGQGYRGQGFGGSMSSFYRVPSFSSSALSLGQNPFRTTYRSLGSSYQPRSIGLSSRSFGGSRSFYGRVSTGSNRLRSLGQPLRTISRRVISTGTRPSYGRRSRTRPSFRLGAPSLSEFVGTRSTRYQVGRSRGVRKSVSKVLRSGSSRRQLRPSSRRLRMPTRRQQRPRGRSVRRRQEQEEVIAIFSLDDNPNQRSTSGLVKKVAQATPVVALPVATEAKIKAAVKDADNVIINVDSGSTGLKKEATKKVVGASSPVVADFILPVAAEGLMVGTSKQAIHKPAVASAEIMKLSLTDAASQTADIIADKKTELLSKVSFPKLTKKSVIASPKVAAPLTDKASQHADQIVDLATEAKIKAAPISVVKAASLPVAVVAAVPVKVADKSIVAKIKADLKVTDADNVQININTAPKTATSTKVADPILPKAAVVKEIVKETVKSVKDVVVEAPKVLKAKDISSVVSSVADASSISVIAPVIEKVVHAAVAHEKVVHDKVAKEVVALEKVVLPIEAVATVLDKVHKSVHPTQH